MKGHWGVLAYAVRADDLLQLLQPRHPGPLSAVPAAPAPLPAPIVTALTICLNVGAILGGLIFGPLSERIGRRRAIVLAALLALPIIPLWAFSTTRRGCWRPGAFLIQIAVQGAWAVVPAHLNELSPPGARGTFPGFAYQLGNLLRRGQRHHADRPVKSHHGDYGFALALVCGVVAVVLALVAWFGPEAKGADSASERQPRRDAFMKFRDAPVTAPARRNPRRPGGARADRLWIDAAHSRAPGEAWPTRHFAALDEQKFQRFHWRAMLVTGLGVFCDGYDISSIGLVLTSALAAYHVATTTCRRPKACSAASALVGSMLGALVFGMLAQKGRKRFYGVDALILGVAALAQAFMPTRLAADRLPLRARHRRRRRLCALADDHGRARQPRRPRQGDRPRLRHHVADRRAGGGAAQAAARTRSMCRRTWSWKLVLAGGAIPALGVMYFRRRMPEIGALPGAGGRRPGRGAGGDREEVGAAAAAAARRRHAPVLAGVPPARRATSSPARCSGCSTTWWSTPRSCSGRTSSPRTCGIPASIYQIETELIFVIPPSILMLAGSSSTGSGESRCRSGASSAGAAMLGLFAWMRTQSPAIPALVAYIVFGLFNVAQTGPGPGLGRRHLWRRAGADPHPQRRPVDHRDRRTDRRGDQRLRVPAAERADRLRRHHARAWRCSRWSAAIASQLLVPETSSRSLEEINLEQRVQRGRRAKASRVAVVGMPQVRCAVPPRGSQADNSRRRLLQRGPRAANAIARNKSRGASCWPRGARARSAAPPAGSARVFGGGGRAALAGRLRFRNAQNFDITNVDAGTTSTTGTRPARAASRACGCATRPAPD